MTQPFDSQLFLRELRQAGCGLGEPHLYFAETGSTNDDAKIALRQGAPHGASFVADVQTHGRGRRGRHWQATPRHSLLFSVIVRPKLSPQEQGPLTLAVGLGVRQALADASGASLQLKWPNDVLAHDRKLAGILAESDGANRGVVLGVGINVHNTDFAQDLGQRATSLALLGAQLRREVLLVNVLRAIEHWLFRLEQRELAGIVAELERWDALRGRALTVEGERGIGAGIDAEGRLLLDIDGKVRAIQSGTVEFR